MAEEQDGRLRRQRTAEIVAAYARHHQISADQLAALISAVHTALAGTAVEPEPEPTPAVPIRRSVHQDYVVCLDCGWRGKMLRRHIASEHRSTPAEYRARWSLSREHPLTAPGYSERRSQYAKQIGLGRRPQTEINSADGEAVEPKPQPPRKRGSSRRRQTRSAAPS